MLPETIYEPTNIKNRKDKLMKEERLYQITYKGELWDEEKCDDIFVSFYHVRYSAAYID